MKKLKLIIADDSKINNDLMKLHLENYEKAEIIAVAEDGIQLLKLIKELQPDIVITDNQMPNMTGIETIEKVKTEKLDKTPQFIIASGDTFRELKFNELNIIGIVGKPIDYNRIINLINDYAQPEEEKVVDTPKVKKNFFEKLFNK